MNVDDYVCRPRRARLSEATSVVIGRRKGSFESPSVAFDTIGPSGIVEPRAAWEAMYSAGLIPASWIEAPDRMFACYFCNGNPSGTPTHYPCPKCVGNWGSAYPTSLAQCVAFAADVEGVLAAEQLAREAIQRLIPWKVDRPTQVVWDAISADPNKPVPLDEDSPLVLQIGAELRMAMRLDVKFIDTNEMGNAPKNLTPAWESHRMKVLAAAWERGVAANGSIRALYDYGQEIVNKRFLWMRDLPNPYEPLAKLWETGYVLNSIDDRSICLSMPDLA